tara:strand:- start:204 stop:398 length:195 start_codon:yes stop_codon:yes gene_type:complete
MKDKKINKLVLIDQLVPQVVESWTRDELISFAVRQLEQDYQYDFDMLVEDALAFDLIDDEEEIV